MEKKKRPDEKNEAEVGKPVQLDEGQNPGESVRKDDSAQPKDRLKGTEPGNLGGRGGRKSPTKR